MKFGSISIVTPYDNPSQYQPDWRHLVAKCRADNPKLVLAPQLAEDQFLMAQIAYLENPEKVKEHEGFINMTGIAERRAFALYAEQDETNIRSYLDPLLLTDQPYSVIARDLGQTEETIQHYERVYWSCRSHDGVSVPSEMLKTSFALGVDTHVTPASQVATIWRLMGAKLGYTALACAWMWQHPSGTVQSESEMFKLLTRINIGRMFQLVLTGQVAPLDINMFFGQYIAHERMRHDTKAGGARDEAMEILLSILQLAAPRMKESAQTGEALMDYTVGPQKVIAARTAIDVTEVSDKGPMAGLDAMNLQLEKAKGPFRQQMQRKLPT